MNKHTAGPWKVSDDLTKDGTPIVRAVRTNEAVCYSPISRVIYERGPSKTEMANARLIAAAPELLEALQGFLDMYVRLVNNDGSGACDPEYDPHVIAARAAIAKATS